MTSERVRPSAQALAVLLVLGFLLLSLRPVLNPFLLWVALLAVLLPNRGLGAYPGVAGVATLLTLLWLLSTTGGILAPFLVALGLAYLLDPAVDALQRRGMGRSVAIAVLVLPVLAALAVGVVLAAPEAGRQVQELLRELPDALGRAASWLEGLGPRLGGVPWVGEALAGVASRLDPESVAAFLEERHEALARRAWAGVLGVGRGISSAISVLGYVVLTPVITFYLLRDWDGLVRRVGELVPRPALPGVADFFRELDDLLGRFLRGQLVVALLMGLLTALGLWAWSFPYAFLIGGLVAVFSVVPYLGLVLSLLPAVAVALVSGQVGYSLLKVAVVFGVVQGLEGTVISPRIVGDSVGLHPVWILLAITAGGFFFGFTGLLLAVPGAAALKLLLRRGVARYRASARYRGAT
ncbi:MAG: AI-2E family transporter [Longimicrobiales bacterium]|nr:AI-2E family transporter [Longimicrobiales bacterium]